MCDTGDDESFLLRDDELFLCDELFDRDLECLCSTASILKKLQSTRAVSVLCVGELIVSFNQFNDLLQQNN